MHKITSHLAYPIAALLLLTACDDSEPSTESLRLSLSDNALILVGEIDAPAADRVLEALYDNPEVRTVVLQEIAGSSDDAANLNLARFLRARGVTTIVPEGGMVASGGTDLLLAGVKRIAAPDACIGVHSWAYEDVSGIEEGRTLPRDHEEHMNYLAFYREIGIDPSFYWFTLNAADSDHIHWMTEAEIIRYAVTTTPFRSSEPPSEKQKRCAQRWE